MRESIKHFFPLILTILCALSGITLLFYGFYNHLYGVFSNATQNNNTTTVAEELESQEKEPLPILTYVGQTLTVGNVNLLSDLFLIKTPSGDTIAPASISDTALYLIDVKSANGSSVLTTLSTIDIDNLNEIPSKAIYDSDKQLLYFYQSGIYTLYVRLHYEHLPGILFECQIPVETR